MDLEARLSDVLSEFARTMGTDFPIQAILDHLVGRIVDVLPISAAGVTLIAADRAPRYVAASDESALRFEQLQTRLGEGPCLAAYQRGAAVAVPDLRTDDRFPQFGPQAVAQGLAAVFTFPLRHGRENLGALDLYRTSPGSLSPDEMAAAQTLADVAAAYLLNAEARAELESSSERARIESLHDVLTGLPNRSLLIERLEHAILRSRRSGRLVAILYADLDGFKAINDTHGHQAGDEALVAVAERMTSVLRSGDTLARMSGDEFVVVCEDLEEVAQVDPIVERVFHALAQPLEMSGAVLQLTASVGVAFAGTGDDVPEETLREADTAMYQAKRRGGGHHAVIDLREQRRTQARHDLARDLRTALPLDQLRVAYQPIVATQDECVVGLEALLRWTHPTLGQVAPLATVQVAEEIGLIGQIGGWVLDQALRDRARANRPVGVAPLSVAVNVSGHQLIAPHFVQEVAGLLARSETPPECVTLELTESVFIADTPGIVDMLHQLKDLGVQLALDDFGTGYSSLSYLTRLPVDVVKIDQVFVAALDTSPRNAVIAKAIVELAHALGLSVIAEGVESVSQHEQIREIGCDAYQGFYFATPMAWTELAAAHPAEAYA